MPQAETKPFSTWLLGHVYPNHIRMVEIPYLEVMGAFKAVYRKGCTQPPALFPKYRRLVIVLNVCFCLVLVQVGYIAAYIQVSVFHVLHGASCVF